MPARPATTDDLARLEQRLIASRRKDLERFATKEDLERFATKKDLERFATKEELERLAADLRGEMATKTDLADLRTELRSEMADMKGELIQHIADASVHTANVVVEQMRHELARHTAAAAEENRALIRALDDKYRDLPGEVAALRRDLDDRCPPAGDDR